MNERDGTSMSLKSKVIACIILAMGVGLMVGCDTTRPGVTRTGTGEFVNYYAATPQAVQTAAVAVVRGV